MIILKTEVHDGKDDSDYLAFKETTWSYSKFVYRSTYLCQPVPPRSQPIQIYCTTITNTQTELRYVHLKECSSRLDFNPLWKMFFVRNLQGSPSPPCQLDKPH